MRGTADADQGKLDSGRRAHGHAQIAADLDHRSRDGADDGACRGAVVRVEEVRRAEDLPVCVIDGLVAGSIRRSWGTDVAQSSASTKDCSVGK